MRHVNGTKKQRAAILLKRVTKGPDYGMTFSGAGLSEEQKKAVEAELVERYKLWSSSWVLPELQNLVPELKAVRP